MIKGPYVSPSTGARKVGGLAISTRSPNVSNVFSHVRTANRSAPLQHRLRKFSSSDDWDDENSTYVPHYISEFKRYELMTELYVPVTWFICKLTLYIM
jgi:hypothetical protein